MAQRSPPPPMQLPGGLAIVCDPPPPSCLPGKVVAFTPPPPTDFPAAQSLPCLLTAPPAPAAYPGALTLSPPPPEKLPRRLDQEVAEPVDASDKETSESGEDSDDSLEVNYERCKSDLDALMAHHSSVMRATARHRFKEDEELPCSAHEMAKQKEAKDKPSFLNRLFHSSSSADKAQGRRESILHQDVSGLDSGWLRRWTSALETEGMACTKVATNGKPYERRVHVDSRNMMVEVHQGRNGTVGISLDDLVDLYVDLESPEFRKYRRRKKEDFSKRALVLQTPARSFSFLFNTSAQRDVLGHYLVYLLKTRNRGVMAEADAASTATRDDEPAATSAPEEGYGKVLYPNKSCYEGDFCQHMRHGHGVLHLPDGTKHESEWRNDERHGPGKEHWADGTVFSGHYVRGMRHGQGVMTWPEGSRYTGMFERGRANGDGELIRTDNSVYRGQFVQDCMSGYGCMRWIDGVEYKGEFAANKRHGLGKMVWTSGKWSSYEGAWKEGVQHGRGILTDQSGVAYVGHFVDGKLDHWKKAKAPSEGPAQDVASGQPN